MQKTIAGNTYDTEVDEDITNDSGEWESVVLYRTADGRYYLEVRKWQVFVDGDWSRYSWWHDQERKIWESLPRKHKRVFTLIRPLSAEQAIDWYLATIVPDCLRDMLVKK